MNRDEWKALVAQMEAATIEEVQLKRDDIASLTTLAKSGVTIKKGERMLRYLDDLLVRKQAMPPPADKPTG